MGFQIPIDNDYPGHPKTMEIKSLTGVPEGDIFPLRLWFWASKFARNGHLKVKEEFLERELGWFAGRGRKRGKLFQSLIDAGFIDEDRETIHDWKTGIGYAIFLYEAKKEAQRKRYAEQQGILPEEFRKSSTHQRDKRNKVGQGGKKKTPPPAPENQIVLRLQELNVPGRMETKLQYAKAWLARMKNDLKEVMKRLDDTDAPGQNLFWFDDNIFGTKSKPKRKSVADQAEALKKKNGRKKK